MKTFVITGGASGIGAALARRVAADGVMLGLVDRGSAHDLEAVADACRNSGATVLTGHLDVCNEALIAQFIEDVRGSSQRLDFVFANAGVVHKPAHDGLSIGDARELMETNYFGAVNTLSPAVRIMEEQGFGGLVAVTSISALVSTQGSGAYSASKAALTMWTDSLRLSLSGTNVRVTNIVLGFVETPMTAGMSHAERLWIDPDVAAKRILDAAHGGVPIASIPSLRNAPWWVLRELPHYVRSPLLTYAYRRFK